MVKDLLRNLLYYSGLIGLWHRIRNRRTLTVLMFHRVLPVGSEIYGAAEKEFTFSVEGFASTLEFLRRHYNVVGQAEVDAWVNGGKRLPDRAALVTFDDGWRDTLEFAAPELVKRSIPGVLFLATEVLDLPGNRWWQDALVEATQDEKDVEHLAQQLSISFGKDEPRGARLQRLAGYFSALPNSERWRVLGSRVPDVPARQMLTRSDLRAWPAQIAIAGHGHSHAPLLAIADPKQDLSAGRDVLREVGGLDHVMSFPHGSWSESLATVARSVGFRICFSSVPTLTSTESVSVFGSPAPIGRIHVPENAWTCRGGRISAPKLASFLFLRAVATC